MHAFALYPVTSIASVGVGDTGALQTFQDAKPLGWFPLMEPPVKAFEFLYKSGGLSEPLRLQ